MQNGGVGPRGDLGLGQRCYIQNILELARCSKIKPAYWFETSTNQTSNECLWCTFLTTLVSLYFSNIKAFLEPFWWPLMIVLCDIYTFGHKIYASLWGSICACYRKVFTVRYLNFPFRIWHPLPEVFLHTERSRKVHHSKSKTYRHFAVLIETEVCSWPAASLCDVEAAGPLTGGTWTGWWEDHWDFSSSHSGLCIKALCEPSEEHHPWCLTPPPETVYPAGLWEKVWEHQTLFSFFALLPPSPLIFLFIFCFIHILTF